MYKKNPNKYYNKMSKCLYEEYKRNGYVTWDEYEKNPEKNEKKVVLIKNKDLKFGTLIVDRPVALRLEEDIVFNPNNENESNKYFRPEKSKKSDRYNNSAFRLGFFAAIIISGKDIIVDLNCKSIAQGIGHYLIQRFYSHIELTNIPFIPTEGPTKFGDKIIAAKNCLIMNGSFKLSSHHAIHGNKNVNVTIENIKIERCELAGIALNGSDKIVVKDVHMDQEFEDVPILGTFSTAVQLMPFLRAAIRCAFRNDAKLDMKQKLDNLEKAVDDAFNDIVKSTNKCEIGKINPNRESTKIFINKDRLHDGTVYGMVFNKLGAAVGALASDRPKKYNAKNISVCNVTIKNLKSKVKEVVALSNGEAPKENIAYNNIGIQTDTAGSVFRILKVLGKDELYHGNVISEAQLALARWSDRYLDNSDINLVKKREEGHFGTLRIHPAVVAWGRTDVNYEDDTGSHKGIITSQTKFSKVMKLAEIKYICNGDSMFHVNKGNFGIRLDSVSEVELKNIDICGVVNNSENGSYLAGSYTNGTNGGHFGQDKMIGYTAREAHGIAIYGCENIKINNMLVGNIISKNGSAFGYKVGGKSKDIRLKNTECGCIKACMKGIKNVMPNKIAVEKCISVDCGSTVYVCNEKCENSV